MSESELDLVKAIARDAGALVEQVKSQGFEVEKKTGDEPVTIADRMASELILSALRNKFPSDSFISEESPPPPDAQQAERVWFIDPIDGTKDFIKGTTGYAVMIGLATAGRPTLGVVFRSSTDECFAGGIGIPAHKESNGRRSDITVSTQNVLSSAKFVASKQNRPPILDEVKDALGLTTEHNLGSVGLKIAVISEGNADIYVNPLSRAKVWDTCAPEAIIFAAGGRMTDVYGNLLDYRGPLTRPHGILGTNGRVHDEASEKLNLLFSPS